ncbi:hypothetical protein D6783_06120 [Candidatus Woesearchaeota archaeon]|nr:MAG: hypothetical protein D6783_06120 [Candidatus Woesearchaeota archaeon]
MQVRHDCLILFNRYEGFRRPEPPPRERAYSGELSDHARARLRKAFDLFLQLFPPRVIENKATKRKQLFRAALVTLTIPSSKIVSLRQGNRDLLQPFLRHLRAPGRAYIWKAEAQKRGQLHYHIVYSHFAHYDEVRVRWNRILKRKGLLDEFARKHHHFNPPSTRVESVRNVRRMGAYFEKYLAKQEVTNLGEGKVWDCSKGLKVNRFSFDLSSSQLHMITSAAAQAKCVLRETENAIVVAGNRKPLSLLNRFYRTRYEAWRKDTLEGLS